MKRALPLLMTVVAMLLASCSGELSVADRYLQQYELQKDDAKEQIYVCLPKEVLHTNSSLNEIEDFAILSPTQQDSIIHSLTALLDKVNDSIFLSQFNQTLLYTLSRCQMPIIIVADSSLLPPADSLHHTLNIVQLEAEEYLQRQRSDFSTRKGTYYKYDYDLRHFSTNVWLKINACDTLQPLYFKNHELSERFHGTITSLKDGKATLQTNFPRLTINDVYYSARTLAATCGELYIERLICEHVKAQKGSNEYYFIYSPEENTITDMIDQEDAKGFGFQKVSQ